MTKEVRLNILTTWLYLLFGHQIYSGMYLDCQNDMRSSTRISLWCERRVNNWRTSRAVLSFPRVCEHISNSAHCFSIFAKKRRRLITVLLRISVAITSQIGRLAAMSTQRGTYWYKRLFFAANRTPKRRRGAGLQQAKKGLPMGKFARFLVGTFFAVCEK